MTCSNSIEARIFTGESALLLVQLVDHYNNHFTQYNC